MCDLAVARDIDPFGICDIFRIARYAKRDICLRCRGRDMQY